ncbi:MAG: sigma-54 dependent transcriptional regulator [Planctomycetota bacterium]
MKPHLSPIARAVLDADYAKVRVITDATRPGDPSYPCVTALRKTTDALENIVPVDQAISALRDAIHQPPDDTELFFLLLGMGVQLSTRLNLPGDGRRFSLSMEELLTDLRHPEFKAFWLNECSRLHDHLHVGTRPSRDILNEALSLDISRDTGLWIRLKLNRALSALREMDSATAEKDLSELESLMPQHPQFTNVFQGFKALWHQQIGNCDEALRFLENIPPNNPYVDAAGVRLWFLSETERWEEFDRELAILKKSPVPFFKPADDSYFRALKEYRQGRPEKARELTREAISLVKEQEAHNPRVFLDECIELLAMVELSLRNSKTARRLLDMLDSDMTLVAYTPLWMRFFLLERNEPRAASFLKRILDIGGGFGSPFLVRGLRKSPEVTAYQIEKLRILASRMPSPPQPPTASSAPKPDTLPVLIGESPVIHRVKTLILKYAPLKTTVLITGETGTGKDIVARLIHEAGRQPELPFIPVNCASIADTLIEAELFGYVKGAFTGATTNHEGLFVTAGEGTLFLDDIDAMSPQLQAALLRVLENGEVRPVGGTHPQQTRARIIAATNRPLEELIRGGTFREDLFYRLARMEIRIPPLRERQEDIAVLARHFLKMIYTPKSGGTPAAAEIPDLGEDLLRSLKKRPWPGNVRELKNEMERMVILTGDRNTLNADLFPEDAAPPGVPIGKNTQPRTQKRRERLRTLFSGQPHLTFQDVVDALHCERHTALSDLRNLEAGGFIRRVERTSGKRTLYYTRAK